MTGAQLSILFLLPFLGTSSFAAPKPDSYVSVKIRTEAIQVAQMLRTMSRIQALQMNSSIEDIVKARMDLRAFQNKLALQFRATRDQGSKDAHTGLTKTINTVNKVLKPLPQIAGWTLLAYGAYKGITWQYHHSADVEWTEHVSGYWDYAYRHGFESFSQWWDHSRDAFFPMAGEGIAGAVLGAVVGGVPLHYLNKVANPGLEDLSRHLRDKTTQDIFFEELKKQKIAVPDSHREEWLASVFDQMAQELFIERSPDLVKLQLELMKQLLSEAMVKINENASHLVPVLQGMIEALEEQTSWKTYVRRKLKFTRQMWAEESYVRFIQVRSKFIELANDLELEKAGFKWREELTTLVQTLGSETHGTQHLQVLTANGVISQRFLGRLTDNLLSDDDVNELYRLLEDPLKTSIDVTFEAGKAPSKILPVGIADFKVTLTLPDGTQHSMTTKAPARSTDLAQLALEDGWIDPVKSALQDLMHQGGVLSKIRDQCSGLLEKKRVASAENEPDSEMDPHEEIAQWVKTRSVRR